LRLQRLTEAYGATIGRLTGPGIDLWTLERPWLNNRQRESCIPPGDYRVQPHGWKGWFQFQNVWGVASVPNRTGILFHPLNSVTETEGCIGVGKGVLLDGSARLLNSKAAIDIMRKLIGQTAFDLTID
jgi:hypothetical protein